MNQCKISGCRYLQTHCVTCGRLVIEKILPKSMEWIDCKEKMPEECTSVLIWSQGYAPVSAYLFYHNESPLFWHVNDWDESDMTYGLNQVTHWMALPEPPENNGVDKC